MTKLKFKDILKDHEQNMSATVSSIEIDDIYGNTDLYLHDTSFENPFGVMNNCLNINREFYEKCSEISKKTIIDAISNTKEDSFRLSNKELINRDVIKALVSNKNIKNLTFDGDIYLNKDTIQYILSSHISHLNCNVNFDNDPDLIYQYIPGLDIINYPEVSGTSVMDFGMEKVELYIIKPLSEKELTHLKILFTLYPQEKTYINLKYKGQLDEIINSINSNKIIIRRFVPYTKEEYIHLNNKYNNVFFGVATNYVTSIESLILREEIMDNIINEVNCHNLSPLEKYMYLYNIVKMYKEYKEVEDKTEPQLSRYSEYTLFNDYMVCVGYAMLLEELVEKLNDKNVICTTYSCDVSDDDGQYGHCRCMTKIKDEKYGIDGIYISDPTWDSIKYYKKEQMRNRKYKLNYKIPMADIDLYNHFLLTKEEIMDELISYPSKDASDALFCYNFNITNIGEYGAISWDIDKINKKFKTNILINKTNYKYKKNPIKSNPISGEVLIQTITNLYTVIYSDKRNNIDKLVQTTIFDNISNQYKNFDSTKDKFGIKTKRKK